MLSGQPCARELNICVSEGEQVSKRQRERDGAGGERGRKERNAHAHIRTHAHSHTQGGGATMVGNAKAGRLSNKPKRKKLSFPDPDRSVSRLAFLKTRARKLDSTAASLISNGPGGKPLTSKVKSSLVQDG